MAEFCHQLLTAHQTEAARAFVPLVTLLENVLDEAVEAGDVRPGLNHAEVAGVILSTIMFNAAYAHTISGVEEARDGDHAANQLWDFLSGGIVTRPRDLSRRGPQARSEGATAARNSRVRSADAFSSSRPSPERHNPRVEVGEAGVGEAAQALLHGGLAAADEHVTDVLRVTVLHQPDVVRGRLHLAQRAVRALHGGLDLVVAAQADGDAGQDAGRRAGPPPRRPS